MAGFETQFDPSTLPRIAPFQSIRPNPKDIQPDEIYEWVQGKSAIRGRDGSLSSANDDRRKVHFRNRHCSVGTRETCLVLMLKQNAMRPTATSRHFFMLVKMKIRPNHSPRVGWAI